MTSNYTTETQGKTFKTTYDFFFQGKCFNGTEIKKTPHHIIVSTETMDTNLYGTTGYYKCLLNGKVYPRKKQIVIYRDSSLKGFYDAVSGYSENFYSWLEENCMEGNFDYYEPRYNTLKFNQYVDGNLEINYWLDEINDMCKGKTYHQIYKEVMLGSGDGILRSFILSKCAGSWWGFYNDIFCLKTN